MSTMLNPSPVGETEGHFVLNGVGWDQYESVLQAFPETPGLRIIYYDRRITLLSPSRRHDWASRRLSELIKAVAVGLGIRWEDAGTTTYRLEHLGAGVEGDDAFYFGRHAELMKGPIDVDLNSQPPPDLVIEVEATHSADDAVAAWIRLGVPEIWRYQVRRKTIQFLTRGEREGYEAAPRSLAFPELEPADIVNQLRIADEMGASDWNEQLNNWVHEVLVPRRFK
jgi:Uma2 family endonuclease